jgi:hypothetical protein
VWFTTQATDHPGGDDFPVMGQNAAEIRACKGAYFLISVNHRALGQVGAGGNKRAEASVNRCNMGV